MSTEEGELNYGGILNISLEEANHQNVHSTLTFSTAISPLLHHCQLHATNRNSSVMNAVSSFKLVGNNINKDVKPRHMRLITVQTKSLHYFSSSRQHTN